MDCFKRTHLVLTLLEKILGVIAAVMLFAIMLIVVADVLLRYLFNAPLTWSYDLISLYLMVGVFFFSLSGTLEHNGHVSVDILQELMPARMRRLTEVIGYSCASVVFAAIVYMAVNRTWESFIANEVAAGSIAWPIWLSTLAVPLGAGLMLLRMLFRVIGYSLSLIEHRSVIVQPPISGTGEAN